MIKVFIQRLNPNGSLSLLLIGLIGTIGLYSLMILPILVGAYIDYLGFDEDTAGWVSAINLAGVAIITLIVSLKTKRWPLHKVASIGLALMLVFDVLSLFFHDLTIFAALRFCSGMAGGAAMAAAGAAIARLKHSEKGYGIYIGCQFLFPAIAMYFLAQSLPSIEFNGMMQIIIGLELLALIATPIFINYPLPAVNSELDTLETKLIFQRPALLSLLGLCVYGAATAAIWAYADRIGIDASLSVKASGNIIAIITGISVLGAILVIYLKDRFGYIKPLSAGLILQIIGLLILMNIHTPIGYTIGIGTFSIAWAFCWPYFLSIQADLDQTGTVVVAGQFTNLLGNATGPAIAAFLVGGGLYSPAIWMACGLTALSLLIMLLIPSAKQTSFASNYRPL
ncbi:MFS transporter [Dasania marina]|uniref:MFS transporter n=1 Tax=Dasania marina TaxID=471499 RepID=UPI0030D8555F|tara:strand:- start:16044 stop:17231 length:1188 start_codon:yes stop_codon:yes gene_type:complete